MGAAKVASGRKIASKIRVLEVNGERKTIYPSWYHGSREGHGNYMTGYYDNNVTVEDKNGRPIPFKQIGQLVRP